MGHFVKYILNYAFTISQADTGKSFDSDTVLLTMQVYWITSLLLLGCMLHYNNSYESMPHGGGESNHHHWMLIKHLLLSRVKSLTGHQKCDLEAGK